MQTPRAGGAQPVNTEGTPHPSTEKNAIDASNAPIQKHISNWERDLVAQRSADRQARETSVDVRHGITMLSAVVGVGCMLLGQPALALAIWGGGILISPGLEPPPRNDRDR